MRERFRGADDQTSQPRPLAYTHEPRSAMSIGLGKVPDRFAPNHVVQELAVFNHGDLLCPHAFIVNCVMPEQGLSLHRSQRRIILDRDEVRQYSTLVARCPLATGTRGLP